MGTTLTTLQFYGLRPEELKPCLQPEDLLRELNAPWLGVVPQEEDPTEAKKRLSKLARQLTKERASASALVFFYLDDESFFCQFYQGGKSCAVCQSGSSWAKLGKKLDELFHDSASSKAFRYASRCSDLEEQLRLLEETIGAALFDLAEEEPRRVPRGDSALREIKAREAALRNRPKQCRLTELPREEWPEDMQTRLRLFELLRPVWWKHRLSSLVYDLHERELAFPHHPELLLLCEWHNNCPAGRVLLFDRRNDKISVPPLPSASRVVPLWQTARKETVLLVDNVSPENDTDIAWLRRNGKSFVLCIGEDGSVSWSFPPEAGSERRFQRVHVSAQGVITLNSMLPEGDTQLRRINGNTGALLCSRRIPAFESAENILAIEALDCFSYFSRTREEWVLLDSELKEKQRWPRCNRITMSSYEERVTGTSIWDKDYRENCLDFFDPAEGRTARIKLEIPAYVIRVLPDGQILGTNEKQNQLTVFDASGFVISRCSVPGILRSVRVEKERVCLVELRGGHPFGLISGETLASVSFHVWRLDSAQPEGQNSTKDKDL